MLQDHLAQLVEIDPWQQVWDDEDEEEEFSSPQPKLYPPLFFFSHSVTNSRVDARLIVIGFRGAASTFLDCVFVEKETFATLHIPEVAMRSNPLSLKAPVPKSCCLLSRYKDVVIVTCDYEVKSARAYAWTQALFEHVRAERVVVLDSLPEHKYHPPVSNEPSSPPFLRMLETSASKKQRQQGSPTSCTYLEPPNLIESGTAAVLTNCQLRNVPAMGFVVVTPSGALTCETVKAFVEVAHCFGLQELQLKLDPKRTQSGLKGSRSERAYVDTALFM